MPYRRAIVMKPSPGCTVWRTTGDVVVGDGARPPWTAGAFDRVLVDAPCSGLGALRRRPESRWRRTRQDVAGLVPLRRDLLGSALEALTDPSVTDSPLPRSSYTLITKAGRIDYSCSMGMYSGTITIS